MRFPASHPTAIDLHARVPSRRTTALALAAVALLAGPPATPSTSAFSEPCGVRLKMLVVSADGREAILPAIRQTLDYLGTPYDVFVATEQPPLTPATLASGCTGLYQATMLTNGELGYTGSDGTYRSAFSPEEFATLEAYESAYAARRVVWYAFPTPLLGWEWPTSATDTSGQPLTAAFTPAGAAVFGRVNTANPLRISMAYAYHARPLDSSAVPLLIDESGNALAVLRRSADGRESLALSFDGNQFLQHTLVLAYDLVSWAARGIFLGERHVYLSPQIDDLFLHNQMWSTDTPCGTPVDATTATYRITGSDYHHVLAWQRRLQARPLTRDVRLTMAFNGEGATGIYHPDDLTPVVAQTSAEFHFVSHTWDHRNLDDISLRDADEEIRLNVTLAKKLKLPLDALSMVTPDVSGLRNPNFLRAAARRGIKYLVSDTSRPGYSNPSPNTGIWNTLQPGIFMIPRYPNNLFFNVSTPAEWAAEYNCLYRGYWGRDLTYEEILDITSDTMVGYLLKGDLNPVMFHQPNLRAYADGRSLLSDLIDATLAKYSRLMTLPILSPSMADVARRMIARETYDGAGVTATMVPGTGLVIRAARDAVVPVTGVQGGWYESYAGQSVSYIWVAAGSATVVPLP